MASLAVACPAAGGKKECDYSGSSYSDGSTSCQSGMQYRRNDGHWTDLSVACSPETPAARIEGSAPTSMFDGVAVSSGSTVCHSGAMYACVDGNLRNVGTPCEYPSYVRRISSPPPKAL